MSATTVTVKLGGTTIVEQQDVLREVVSERAARPVVVVHGGGNSAVVGWDEQGTMRPLAVPADPNLLVAPVADPLGVVVLEQRSVHRKDASGIEAIRQRKRSIHRGDIGEDGRGVSAGGPSIAELGKGDGLGRRGELFDLGRRG
mgnify:CR=1 FL=1